VTTTPVRRFQFIRFLVAAGLSVPVNLASRVLFSHWMPYELAIVLAHVCGMLTAYALTRLFVFEPSGRPGHVEVARFTVVNLVSVTITWLVAVGLVRYVFPTVGFDRQPELVGHVAGLVVSSISSFYGHRHYSFGRRRRRS
jgi:putative flippase GtrA